MIQVNGTEVKFTTFPNGETKVDEKSFEELEGSEFTISFKYENDSDLIKLMLVKRHIDSYDVKSSLVIYYMPYSRMDRSENDSVFTLKHVAEFINNLSFTHVIVVEPHSDVTPALLNNCIPVYVNFDLINNVMDEVKFDKENDYLFFPDAGAQKRYSKMEAPKQLVGYKKRDWETGRITSLDLVGDLPTKPFKVIIVDDLCSYGGTFIMSANKLIAAGATEVYLLVAHCEESIFRGGIFTGGRQIKKVFTTDSILDSSDLGGVVVTDLYGDMLKVYKIQEVI